MLLAVHRAEIPCALGCQAILAAANKYALCSPKVRCSAAQAALDPKSA